MLKKQRNIGNRKAINKTSGITLIALVVTVIVILILSGISIGMLTGDNGIINQAGNAKEQVIIEQEREQIELACTLVNELEITDKTLKKQLQKNGNNVDVSYSEFASSGDPEINIDDYVFETQGELLVEFNDTHHKYLVDVDGNVSDLLQQAPNSNTDWEKINYELRTDDEGQEYYAVTGLKNGVSKTSITKIDIAKTYKGIPVKTIEAQAFYLCTNALKVTIPDGVNSIGDAAFSNCTKLENAKLGMNIKSIGMNGFVGCTSLKHINIPNSITNCGGYVFSGCTKLTKAGVGITEGIELEDGITQIPPYLFNSSNLEEITIPNTVTLIGKAAFNQCGRLLEITIPDGVTTIGDAAFSNCTKLENAKLGMNIKSIGRNGFVGCTSLKHINIPNSITNCGSYVFSGCTKLTKAGVGITEGIELEDGITQIPPYLFNSSNLEEITIPNTVILIGRAAFSQCSRLLEITIPDGVTTIGDATFMSCTNLETIIYKGSSHTTEASLKSAGITSIATNAFTGTKITKE